MEIPMQAVERYSASVEAQANEAAAKLEQYLRTLDFTGDYKAKQQARNQAIEYFSDLLEIYGYAAATLASDFYEELAELEGATVSTPELAGFNKESVANTVRYNARYLFGNATNEEQFIFALNAAMHRYVLRMANETITKNAARDGKSMKVKFARIPTGAETCYFCIMLASRGFVYANETTAGEFNHYHDNCDCKVIPGFSGDVSIEGYSEQPYRDFYYDMVVYDEYNHVDVNATESNMRRALYPQIKDKRNARRREQYQRSKESEE